MYSLTDQVSDLICDVIDEYPPSYIRPWSPAEDAFLHDNVGFMHEQDIADHLGRTRNAVHLRWERDLGLPSPSTHPEWLTANRAGQLLGIDVKAVIQLIERNLLSARLLPLDRKTWSINRRMLLRWVINPNNWPYIIHIVRDPSRITDPRWRRLLELRKQRWPDEWLSTREVGQLHGVNHTTVNNQIHRKNIPSVKYHNHWMRRLVAEQLTCVPGMGNNGLSWSDDFDAYVILARALGIPAPIIARQARHTRSEKQINHRIIYLHRIGAIPDIIARHNLKVQYHPRSGRLWADWRDYAGRFKWLARLHRRSKSGQPMTPTQRKTLQVIRTTHTKYHRACANSTVATLESKLTG